MSETVYKMQPAGHDAPAPRRKYPEPDRKLRESFERWLVGANPYDHDEAYLKGEELTQTLPCTPDEAHGLLVAFQDDKRIHWAGPFISALYNSTPCKEIVYDLPLTINSLGYLLSSGKILFNYSSLGREAGRASKGCLFNFGIADDRLGCYSNGLIVNYGISKNIGTDAYGTVLDFSIEKYWGSSPIGIFIDAPSGPDNPSISDIKIIVRDPRNAKYFLGSAIGKIIGEDQCKKIPELYNYIQNLHVKFKVGKTDYRKVAHALSELGNIPCGKIRQDLVDILRRAGKNV